MGEIKDNVNHPEHYTSGRTEVIDVIEDYTGVISLLGFCRGNAIKYILRAGKKDKDKVIEDLEKAVWYLNKEIATRKRLESNE